MSGAGVKTVFVVLLSGACTISATHNYGVYGFFCENDSAGMSQAGSDECWRLGPGVDTYHISVAG